MMQESVEEHPELSSRPTLVQYEREPGPARLLVLAVLVAVIYLLFFGLMAAATSTTQGPFGSSVLPPQPPPRQLPLKSAQQSPPEPSP